MEAILAIGTVIGGIAAICYFWEKLQPQVDKWRRRFCAHNTDFRPQGPSNEPARERSAKTQDPRVSPLDQEQLAFFLSLFRNKDFVFVPDVRDTGAPYRFLGKLKGLALLDVEPDRRERTYFLTDQGRALRQRWAPAFRV